MNKQKTLTLKELNEKLDYDPVGGSFTWKYTNMHHETGDVAGTIDPYGFRHIHIGSHTYMASHLALYIGNRKWPTKMVKHIDHQDDNDAIDNLREFRDGELVQHDCKLQTNNTSGVTGVHWEAAAQKWRAQIKVKGQSIRLGSFKAKADAIAARKAGEIQYGFAATCGELRPNRSYITKRRMTPAASYTGAI